jgi:hypothetical protein
MDLMATLPQKDDRSKRRKRQKLLIRIDHFISCTLGAAIPPAKWTLA